MTAESNARRKARGSGVGRSRAELLAVAAPVIFLLLWSSGFGVAKVGLRYTGPLTFLMLRYALIVLLFIPIFALWRPPLPGTRAAWTHILVVGFLLQFVYFGLAYTALGLGVSAGVAAVITSTQPLVVAAAAPWLTSEQVGLRRWIGLLLGAVGAITVVMASPTFQASRDNGLLLCVASMFGMATATLYQKRFVTHAHPITVNLIHSLVGLVMIAPMAFLFEPVRVEWTPDFLASFAWITVMNSVVAISLLLFMIGRSEASRVSSLFFLVPPMAAVFGWLLLGETLSRVGCGGMIVAAGGVWLVSRSA